MELSYERLTESQISASLPTVPGWSVHEGALQRKYEFSAYADGVLYANAVAAVADRLNHHPDILIGYKHVTISMVSHDAAGKLTAYDFELARRINAIP